MYDPTIARFLQEDTYTGNQNDPLSLNLYAYCNNNPLVYSDPTGHWPKFLDNAINFAGNVAEDVVNWASDAWEGAKNTAADTWAGVKSGASAMYGAIKKGNPNVIGEGVKAAASGYAESKANREAKKKSENSGKGITIANYGVANIGDVNNKLNKVMNKNSTKQDSIGALGAVGISSLGISSLRVGSLEGVGTLGLPQTIGASIPSILETIGSVGVGFAAPQVALMGVVAIGVLLALPGEKVGQSEDEEKAAVEAANQKKKNDKGDTEGEDEADKIGGAYKNVPANGGQVHHMPADSISPYSKGEGPGIRMETRDHMDTESWGSSKKAKQYRQSQKDLIDQGKFEEAQQKDIDDVKTKFGDKYDDAIQQMLDYTKELLSKNKK